MTDYLGVLKSAGTLVVIGESMKRLIRTWQAKKKASDGKGKQIHITELQQEPSDLSFLKELLGTGKVKPVIDGIYPLESTADAFRYYEREHPRGKVVIRIENMEID